MMVLSDLAKNVGIGCSVTIQAELEKAAKAPLLVGVWRKSEQRKWE